MMLSFDQSSISLKLYSSMRYKRVLELATCCRYWQTQTKTQTDTRAVQLASKQASNKQRVILMMNE